MLDQPTQSLQSTWRTNIRNVGRTTLWFWTATIMIVLFASYIRLHDLEAYPQRFNQDEMVLGYDAWSIWQTGHDHHGNLLPINFRSFNDYVPPVSIYLTAPFVGLLGLQEATTRLPFVLTGTATVLFVALLGRQWFGRAAGLIAALLLAVEPWHVNYSRIAFPASVVPFFTIVALYTFTRATRSLKHAGVRGNNPGRRTYLWFAACAASFALLTGCYPTMKLEAPVLIGVCVAAAAPLFWRHRGLCIGWLALYALFVSPLVLSMLLQWSQVNTRYNDVSPLNDPDWFIRAVRLYSDHYNPGALAFTGFGGGVAVRRPLYIGELFWLDIPLCGLAFWGLAQPQRKLRRVAFSLLILLGLWLITYPIADSLTIGDALRGLPTGGPHEIRSYNFLPLPELLAGYGAIVLWNMLKTRRIGRVLAVALGVSGAAVYAIFVGVSLSYFFSTPLLQTNLLSAAMPPNVGLRPVLEKVAAEAKPCDVIWMDRLNQTYIYYLFLTRYPPAKVQQFDLSSTASDGWLDIQQIGQVHFGGFNPDYPFGYSTPPECAGVPHSSYFVTSSDPKWPDWQSIISIHNAYGALIWQALVHSS